MRHPQMHHLPPGIIGLIIRHSLAPPTTYARPAVASRSTHSTDATWVRSGSDDPDYCGSQPKDSQDLPAPSCADFAPSPASNLEHFSDRLDEALQDLSSGWPSAERTFSFAEITYNQALFAIDRLDLIRRAPQAEYHEASQVLVLRVLHPMHDQLAQGLLQGVFREFICLAPETSGEESNPAYHQRITDWMTALSSKGNSRQSRRFRAPLSYCPNSSLTSLLLCRFQSILSYVR